MSGLLNVLLVNRRKSMSATIAQKDAEITRLKSRVSELYMENDELGRENRKLRIRNGEVEVAYSSLKEILRKRGACTP